MSLDIGICQKCGQRLDNHTTVYYGIGGSPLPLYICPANNTNTIRTGSRKFEQASAAERKEYPVATGVLDYFPKALLEIAHVSFMGSKQHHPGEPVHWDRSKSTDEADAMIRHFIQRGTFDSDGIRHSAKMAWRALAFLERELEKEEK